MSTSRYHGSLVAFEGSSNSSVCTQLRLLPVSPQILILPSIQSYLPSETTGESFHGPTFVRNIHDAAAARTKAALSFLTQASAASKRLVFLNGGTLSAYALCIRAIAEHETGGDVERAQDLFQAYVAKGLANLLEAERSIQKRQPLEYASEGESEAFLLQDPITRAMRAADALDRQTESLQPSTDLDLTLSVRPPRPRSMSLPIYGYVDHLGDSAPFYVFGARVEGLVCEENVFDDQEDEDSGAGRTFFLQSPRLELRSFYDDPDDVEPLDSSLASPVSPRSPSCIGEAYRQSICSALAHDDDDTVIFGEASILHGMEICLPAYRRVCKSITDLGLLKMEGGFLASIPIVVQPKKPRKQGRASYVDRGTDAHDTATSSEPILPFNEDLVVYFKDSHPDPLLERIVQAFRDGTYARPQSCQPRESDNRPQDRTPTPVKQETPPQLDGDTMSIQTTTEDEYDPFSYQNQPSWMSTSKLTMASTTTVCTPRPPTPARTPPTPPSPHLSVATERRIVDFDIAGKPTAVSVQNSLRSLLGEHFPTEENGFHQFNFHHLPELDSFWRPIFREIGDEGKDEDGDNARIVDQIIAFGSQAGVKRDFVSSVGRKLEKLGTQPSGVSRSGRLDFRYLIANAMQAFTAQPLAKQTNDNPFTNPYLLATLVIPHLETYLAAHSEVRLLILEYPPEHLATVLAMQRLVGVDLMKVAQIMDSKLGKSLFAPIRGHRSHESSEAPTPVTSPTGYYGINPSPTRPVENVTPATANYLLTSTATDAEVSTFLSTISKILSEISSFYTCHINHSGYHQYHFHQMDLASSESSSTHARAGPSPNPRAISPALSGATFSTIPHLTISSQSPPHSPASLLHRLPTHSPSPVPPAETPIQTPRSQRGRFSPTGSATSGASSAVHSRKRLPLEHEDEGVGLDLEDSEDFEDLEEKRLMPIFMRRPAARKSDSYKALKFLGLA
ncbi:hypothetical protein jhhlp_002156 [Lomentospora prolificans]|uniref:Uncharacterized protein n=1 Tax=Lomentospora prolificans TaxID=41688 RepID=A0A2N3ND87_9PEZI|nr:hypothetical protein jhhlp_002156 [Lomentospora prolificans]